MKLSVTQNSSRNKLFFQSFAQPPTLTEGGHENPPEILVKYRALFLSLFYLCIELTLHSVSIFRVVYKDFMRHFVLNLKLQDSGSLARPKLQPTRMPVSCFDCRVMLKNLLC